MKWFSAILVMQCRVGKEAARLWDSQVRLIRARKAEQAFKLALQLGKAEETVYQNSKGEPVSWKFIGLGELDELLESSIRSGIEVHSKLSRGKRPPQTLRKSQLGVFWYERTKNKTAGELLRGSALRKFAPR